MNSHLFYWLQILSGENFVQDTSERKDRQTDAQAIPSSNELQQDDVLSSPPVLDGRDVAVDILEEKPREDPRICPIEDGRCDDEEEKFILVPEPGLPNILIHEYLCNPVSFNPNNPKLRRAPNECSICLCEYSVGSDIVWSSNPLCDHVFHETCIEQWLMKQRGGPLCPCCRRDFVIDPFDLGQEDEEATADIELGTVPTSNSEPLSNSAQPLEGVGSDVTVGRSDPR
jgi:hypothetical protein